MITGEKYIILDKPTDIEILKEDLCIINFDIFEENLYLKKLIENNPDTTFWAVSNNYSKEFVLCASKLGIKNVVNFPIKKELIDKFFKHEKNEAIFDSKSVKYDKLSNMKVMIVDDNKMNISLLEEILADTGIKIDSFTDSVFALNRAKSEKYNLFLLDILMPEMSGFELAQAIAESTVNKDTPIIFISAISGDENILNGYSLGAYSYIEKPFSPSIVKAQIYNILKKEEDKISKERERDSFIASLTHDLKSPINAEITALNYILGKDINNSEEILAELLNSAKYMKHITDKILCNYKQGSDKIPLKKEYFRLNSLILSSIEDMKYLAGDKNIKIRFESTDGDIGVFADYIEIKRVVNNLISNAIEYSFSDTYIDIKVEKSKGNIKFSIRDYGIGIDLNKYPKVFDEYMSLSKDQKRVGFGLGLCICQRIVNAHNGEISIESTVNKGTTVTFTLPSDETANN